MADATLPGLFLTGNHASRPAATAVGSGALYSCTTHSLLYQSDGATWSTWATLGTAASGAVTASGYTMATARLLGRTTASSGAIEEITVGSGLSLAAGALTATGSAADLASGKVKRTAGDVTTTSTSFVDLTAASITFTTGARKAHLAFNGSWFCSAANTMAIDFDVDGTRVFGGNFPNAWNINHAGQAIPICMAVDTDALSAGSHTFKVQWKVSGGTGTIQGTTDTPYIFSAHEIYAA